MSLLDVFSPQPVMSTAHICQILEADRAIIADDRVKLEIISFMDPQQMSPYGEDDFGFQTLKTSIRQVWRHHNVIVAPGESTLMCHTPVPMIGLGGGGGVTPSQPL